MRDLPDATEPLAAGDLEEAVRGVFGERGALADVVAGYRPRPGQLRMALAVARKIESGGALVVEAPTGVGKTFAYLVPALLSGERVIVSTATKALQEQLYTRDLPRLTHALGLPVRTALLKGRSSYLCLHRLEQAVHGEPQHTAKRRQQLAEIDRWAKATRTGDLAELPWLDDDSPLIPLVTSTPENCLGADCPQFRACHVNLARRQAMAADVVVINHHLFFADLAIRESGMAELLPTVRCVIFDEAHKFNEAGVQFLGRQLGSAQLLSLARDLLAAGLQQARGLFDWRELASDLEIAARELRLVVGTRARVGRLRWRVAVPEGVSEANWNAALARVQAGLAAAVEALRAASESAPDFARLLVRAERLLALANSFSQPPDPAQVRWVEASGSVRLVESPLDVAETVRSRLLVPADGSESAHGRSWVFVSATLGDDERLSWFTEPCGLQDAEVVRIESPFHYAEQAALYVPPNFARPGDPAHSAQVARLAADAVVKLGGRTLVLTTTLRALQRIGQLLTDLLTAQPGLDVLMQGGAPKRVLMERFRHGGSADHGGCVLVASASFWEGFDVPGDALQLVIIDKLPFPPPDDPLVDARCRRIEAEGGRPFPGYSVPAAAVALKQGAGRLIRTETDEGLLVICDVRLATMGYGRRLLAALPPMRRLSTQEEFDAALRRLSGHGAMSRGELFPGVA